VEAVLHFPRVIRETIIAAAFLSTQSPYFLPPGEETDARKAHHRFRDDNGAFVSYLKLFNAYNDSANKAKFCERNYLDEKAMAEIVNVVSQLEEILFNLKIPVLSGGNVYDYLCCVGRGMIQFVCVRDGHGRNTSYRTLTADKIIIHPGSVMFRMDPQYIVAGEIVRTSRMYAMSVSPLTPEILKELGIADYPEFRGQDSGEEKRKDRKKETRHQADTAAAMNEFAVNRGGGAAAADDGETRDKGRRRLKKARDFTNNIKISGEVFEIKTIKGKKTVILPWGKLLTIRDHLPVETMYRGLKGCVIYEDKYTLLAGEKLDLILSLASSLDPENARGRDWPRKRNFTSDSGLSSLLDYIEILVKPILWKKDSKELGFLSLFTDGKGNYWLRCSRGFHTCLNESMASLETLIDELGDDVDIMQKHIVNHTYRRLSDMVAGSRG
jgi:hypothetical protein